jgi:hypothetical protein
VPRAHRVVFSSRHRRYHIQQAAQQRTGYDGAE